MTQKARKYFQTALKLLVSGAALFYVLSNTDLDSLGSLLRKSNIILLFIALLFFVLSKILSARRLNVFLRSEGISLSNSSNLKLYWLGMFYNLFLPGGIGGDGYKVYYLNRHLSAPVKTSIKVVLFDRVTGVLSLILICILCLGFIPGLRVSIIVSLISALLTVIVFYFIVKWMFREFYRHLHRTNLQSLAVQGAQLVCALLILLALREKQDIPTYLFIFLISSVVAVIPFTVGGIGARELTFLYAARLLDLDVTVSVSLSLLFFIITAVVSLGGLYYSVRPELIKEKNYRDDTKTVFTN